MPSPSLAIGGGAVRAVRHQLGTPARLRGTATAQVSHRYLRAMWKGVSVLNALSAMCDSSVCVGSRR